MKRSILIVLGTFLVLLTLTAWVVQPLIPITLFGKARAFFWVLYVLQLTAMVMNCREKSKYRFLFLLLAMCTPAVEILWHYVYMSNTPLEDDIFWYFRSNVPSASIYVVYCIFIPVAAYIGSMLVNKNAEQSQVAHAM